MHLILINIYYNLQVLILLLLCYNKMVHMMHTFIKLQNDIFGRVLTEALTLELLNFPFTFVVSNPMYASIIIVILELMMHAQYLPLILVSSKHYEKVNLNSKKTCH